MESADDRSPDLNKIIGLKLKTLRQRNELSQQNVADDLGISATAYSKIENGRTSMSLNRLSQISKYYNVFIPDLLDYRVGMPRMLHEIEDTSEYDQRIGRYLEKFLTDLQESYKRGK